MTSFVWATGSNLAGTSRAQRALLPARAAGTFREGDESRTGRPRGRPAAYPWRGCCRRPRRPSVSGQDLPQWIAGTREAGLPGLASFAKGLEQDLGAVTLSGT